MIYVLKIWLFHRLPYYTVEESTCLLRTLLIVYPSFFCPERGQSSALLYKRRYEYSLTVLVIIDSRLWNMLVYVSKNLPPSSFLPRVYHMCRIHSTTVKKSLHLSSRAFRTDRMHDKKFPPTECNCSYEHGMVIREKIFFSSDVLPVPPPSAIKSVIDTVELCP